ncbi:SH3 domain-containing protein [Rhodovastum atsumiense]|nr:SH3 domain-containing protein [Rhodovastum atsumiense]CAH2599887.1 SH3 domain-containing protein [Rhodovastum atsumiense]
MGHFGKSAFLSGVALLTAGLLSGCDEKPRPPANAQGPSSDTVAHARRVAEEKIRSNLRTPETARFRGVQIYQQADNRVVAVCGQVNPSGRQDQAFIPFVSVVTYTRRPDSGTPAFDIEQYIGTSNSEATRVYIEMTSRCGENGGPWQIGARQVIPPLPPLPSDLPDQIQPSQPSRTGSGVAGPVGLTPVPVPVPVPVPGPGRPMEAAPVSTAASGPNVTMRQAGNIRTAPVGGSPLVRVAPKGAVLKVFAQAPGGWLQVGETEAEGWVHSSLVETP